MAVRGFRGRWPISWRPASIVPIPVCPSNWPSCWLTFDDMIEHYGEQTGCRLARKHVAWYSKGLAGSTDFRCRINQSLEAHEVRRMIIEFYDPLLQRMAA